VTKAEKLFLRAMEAVAETSPTSILGDLLMLFPADVAVKLIVTFAGETVNFPNLDVIWRSYRAKVIRSALNAKNSSAERARLAAYFCISTEKVSQIYSHERSKERKRVTDFQLVKTAKRVYRNQLSGLFEGVRMSLGVSDKEKRQKIEK